MQKLVFINGAGNEIDLTAGNFGIVNWAGLSNTSLNIQTQQVPFEDGGVFLDALMEQREIEVTVAIYDGNNLELRYQKKRELISALNPKLGEGTLIYTNDYLSRQIKAVPQIPLFENKNSNDVGTLKASVAFSCPSPYWEDVEENEAYFNIGSSKVIENKGDVPCQMKIDLFTLGVTNPQITNLTTKETIKFNGTLNEALYIDTNIGQKQVYSEKANFKMKNNGNDLNSVCYADELGLFIAVGNNGVIIKSEDGENWILAQYEATQKATLNSVIYAEEKHLFVAVGYNGFIVTSPDGNNWTERENNITNNLTGVLFGKNEFVAFSKESDVIAKSSDGVIWIATATGTQMLSICYSEDDEIYVGLGNRIFTSADCISWEQKSQVSNVQKIKYFKELHKYIAWGSYIYESSDLENWTSNSEWGGSESDLTYIELLNSFVSVGKGGYPYNPVVSINESSVATSNIWKTYRYGINIIGGYWIEGGLLSAVYSKYLNKIVAVGLCGIIMTATNLLDWDYKEQLLYTNFDTVTYSKKDDLFVFDIEAYRTDSLCSTTNFDNIEIDYTPTGDYFSPSQTIYFEEVEKYFSVGGNYIIKSSDGRNWEKQVIEDCDFTSITYSKKNNLFYLLDRTGKVYTSSDGDNWILSGDITATNAVYIIAVDDLDLLIACGDGYIYTYKNDSWQDIQMNCFINRIAYSKDMKLFVAISNESYDIRTSTDGIEWTLADESTETGNYNSVIYSKVYSMFIACGTDGIICFSSDGKTWEKNKKGITSELNNILEIDNDVYFFGEGTTIEVLSYELDKNELQNLSQDSYMGMKLNIGKNIFSLANDGGSFSVRIKYRQKYIGV